jgi:hypothetical protein
MNNVKNTITKFILKDIEISTYLKNNLPYLNGNNIASLTNKPLTFYTNQTNFKQLKRIISSEIKLPIKQLTHKIKKHLYLHPKLAINIFPMFLTEIKNYVLVFELEEENKKIHTEYFNLLKAHDSLKKKRNYYKFEKGNCCYIISDKWRPDLYYKIGCTNNINDRLENYRTSMPDCKLEFLVFVEDCELLEKCIKHKFRENFIENNHEYIHGLNLEKIIDGIKNVISEINLPIKYCENLDLYNEPYKYKKRCNSI